MVPGERSGTDKWGPDCFLRLSRPDLRMRTTVTPNLYTIPALPMAEQDDTRTRGAEEDEWTPVYLFGAGQVGRAVALALAPLPFRVTWIDPRANAFPDPMPGGALMRIVADPATALAEAPAGSCVLVMTHSHALNLDIAARALASPRFPYVGLIGGATTRLRFLARLRTAGLGEDAAARLVCPVGLAAIRSRLPPAIAAGVAADLMRRRGRGAVAPKEDGAHA
jgi:xanthine/CO dehydrogenase XdhC/CoxF family maturation factor